MARTRIDEVRLEGTLGFMQQLWQLVHALEERSRRMAASVGVTGPQRLVVRLVGRHAGISAGGLADTMKVHPSTLTGILQRLVKRGYVARSVDPEDARRAVLTLTATGKAVDSRRGGTVEAAIRRALGRVVASDIEAAQRVLAAISQELEREDA